MGSFVTRMTILRAVWLLLVAGMMVLCQNFRGSLVGTITDTSGARVPSATIALQLEGSAEERRATGNGLGEFRFNDLLPGAYRVTVQAPGFSDAQATVRVLVRLLS